MDNWHSGGEEQQHSLHLPQPPKSIYAITGQCEIGGSVGFPYESLRCRTLNLNLTITLKKTRNPTLNVTQGIKSSNDGGCAIQDGGCARLLSTRQRSRLAIKGVGSTNQKKGIGPAVRICLHSAVSLQGRISI